MVWFVFRLLGWFVFFFVLLWLGFRLSSGWVFSCFAGGRKLEDWGTKQESSVQEKWKATIPHSGLLLFLKFVTLHDFNVEVRF